MIIYGDRETEWSDASLALIFARYAKPLPKRCANLRCGKDRKRRADLKGYEGGCGYCANCYNRWVFHGRQPEGPPDALTPDEVLAVARAKQAEMRAGGHKHVRDMAPAWAAVAEHRMARQENFCFLRETGSSVAEAAGRLDVCLDTAQEYERMRLAGRISADMGYDLDEEIAA